MRLKSPAGPQDGTTPAPPAEKPTAYRTVGSLVTGILLVVFGLIGFSAFGFGADRHPLGAAIGLLLAVGGFVGGLYPSAYSYRERYVIRNPFRLIVVPWPRVEDVVARLSLVVTAKAEAGQEKGRGFTVWAIPVSMHDRRKLDKTAAKRVRSERNTALRAARGAGNMDAMIHGGIGAPSPSAAARRGQNEMIEALAFADQAVIEMRDRMRACETPVEASAPVTVTWTWYTLGLVAVSVLLVVLAAAGVAI